MESVTLTLWGDGGFFRRSEAGNECMSYEVIPPSAIRGILQRIYSHPAIRWVADSILVLSPIQMETVLLEDPGAEPHAGAWGNRSQAGASGYPESGDEFHRRQATITLGTNYIVEAHLELTADVDEGDSIEKHRNAFRKVARGHQRVRPYFGHWQYPVSYTLIESEDDPEPYQDSSFHDTDVDLGLMPCDVPPGEASRDFQARMVGGFIRIPPWREVPVSS